MNLARRAHHGLGDPPEPRPASHRERSAFAKFLLVGALAYAVSQLALFLIYDANFIPGLPEKEADADFGLFSYPDTLLLIAAVVAVQAAVIFKFFLYDFWIFRHRDRTKWIGYRFLQFNISCIFTSVIVVAVINSLTLLLDLQPAISLSVGVLASFMLNWLLSSRFIWQHATTDQELR